MRFFITGAAGFIGFHLAKRLLEEGSKVFGIDNLNPYYDPKLKADRLDILKGFGQFEFEKLDLEDSPGVSRVLRESRFDAVIHLAAQAGVRYSLENPHAYISANVVGFMNILEGCREAAVPHLVFASSSSVYGANTVMPFSVHHNVDHPISLYAATKKANELMAHTYASLYGMPCTGLRFFTVYGPWGRPDMALFKFTRSMLAGEAIDIYNFGEMQRDFTYVDDIVEALVRVLPLKPEPDASWDGSRPDPGTSFAPYRIYNIGGSRPVSLMHFITTLETALGVQAVKNLLPLQKGDVKATCADAQDLEKAVGFRPQVTVEEGIARFVQWYRGYYGV
jgi:UDP-glucuronate 4-epimerase